MKLEELSKYAKISTNQGCVEMSFEIFGIGNGTRISARPCYQQHI